MNGRIFLCHHLVPDRILTTSLFSTLLSGHYDDPRTGRLGDRSGANIAEPNWHSEMRHQYHVWHDHLDELDYVGFEHYRRLFFINPLNAVRMRRFNPWLLDITNQILADETCAGALLDDALFDAYLDLREICDGEMKSFMDFVMTDADIVTQRVQPFRLDEQFKSFHPTEHWDTFVATVKETTFFARSAELVDFSLRTTFFCNMHVARSAVFREYMEFWWEVMERLETRIPLTERYLGHFAERLVNLFVHGKRLQDARFRARSLPFVVRQPPSGQA